MSDSFIPYGRQNISDSDIQHVVDVLRSDFLTQGPMVPAFERAVSLYCNTEYAIAINSATSALHLACLALNVGAGDVIWTSPITFVATANCARYCLAEVDFVDINPNTFNICVDALEEKLRLAANHNKLPKVVIAVHMCGQPCEMERIYQLSKEYGFSIIEDASHAIGSHYKDQATGNCRYSDITVFSFHPVKIITTGEGGIATTNNQSLAEKMQLLRSHGVTRDPARMQGSADGAWYYEQIMLGFNYRMTDIHAALGVSQMGHLDEFITKRQHLAQRYLDRLSDLPVSVQSIHPDTTSSFHLFVIKLQLDQLSNTHTQVFDTLRESGIGVNLHYIPVYLQPYYQRLGFKRGYCTAAEHYYSQAISLPMFAQMTHDQQDRVVSALQGATLR